MDDKEEKILNNIKIVTEGIQKDIGLDNSFSSWKNTEKGLRFIKNDIEKFYLGVKMWINIVEDQILHCNDISLLKSIINNYKWIENFLEIKDNV
jgi:hypothetical protein